MLFLESELLTAGFERSQEWREGVLTDLLVGLAALQVCEMLLKKEEYW
jgi:hypothetical protein